MQAAYESIRSWGARYADHLMALGPAHSQLQNEADKYVASQGNLSLEPFLQAAAVNADTAQVILDAPPSGDERFDAAVRTAASACRDAANLASNTPDAVGEMLLGAGADLNARATAAFDEAIGRMRDVGFDL